MTPAVRHPAFLTMLGGHWVGGGSTGEFAPAQIGFGGGLYRQVLGLTEDEYEQLVAEGHLSQDYLDREGHSL